MHDRDRGACCDAGAAVGTGNYGTTGTWRFDNVAISGDPIASAPGVPSGLNVVPGNAGLEVSFTPPGSNGGSPITGYEYSTDGGITFTSSGVGAASSFTITTISSAPLPLVNGASYAVQVRAVNSAGVGAATASVNGTPQDAATPPADPVIATGAGEIAGMPSDMVARAYVFIGDHSPSNSETWDITVGDYTHSAPGFGVVQRDTREFKKGESYPVTVQHTGSIYPTGQEDFDYRAWVDRYATPTWTSGNPIPSGHEFFVTDSQHLFQRQYWSETGESDPTFGKEATIHFPAIDLDMDSDGNGVLERSLDEDVTGTRTLLIQYTCNRTAPGASGGL